MPVIVQSSRSVLGVRAGVSPMPTKLGQEKVAAKCGGMDFTFLAPPTGFANGPTSLTESINTI